MSARTTIAFGALFFATLALSMAFIAYRGDAMGILLAVYHLCV